MSVEFISLYWIFFANNWGIYVNWRVSVPYRTFVTSTTVGTRGKKICHVEKFDQMTDFHVDKFLTWQIILWKKFSTLEMWRKCVMWRKNVSNLWCFVAKMWFTQFCCDICFVAIYALLRGEKFSKELRPVEYISNWNMCNTGANLPGTICNQHPNVFKFSWHNNSWLDVFKGKE